MNTEEDLIKLCKIAEFVNEMIETEYDEGGFKTEEYENEKENYFILTLKDRAQLKNGFRFIKELLLNYHNFKMYEDYVDLKKALVSVYSVKNDAFVIGQSDVEKAKGLLNFHGGVGGWRVDKTSDIKLPTVKYELIKNELIEIPVSHNEEILVKDEYDTDKIIDEIVEKNPVMIRGLFAGTGKSYICQRMIHKNYKVVY